ncbi:magnesium transporter [Hippea maritima]|uniref:Magnesium transporter MgtE n=1 Tax=Hippea maritima (strain ATCC 700847 / DSM 10411 / MH2) TaxID=760142 RepID=F2LUJ3_HIPMA|nr:magnesium transporter [Hippea maritima]AEA34583.1 magnesium transporter [Hippea maritima DSM 10411]
MAKEHIETKMILQTVRKFIRKEASENVAKILKKLHPADIAKIVQNLAPDERAFAIKAIDDLELKAEAIEYLDDYTIAAEILEQLTPQNAARIIQSISVDKAVDILEELNEEFADEVYKHLEDKFKEEIHSLSRYPEDTAGGIMNPDFFAIDKDLTVKDALEKIRKASKEKKIIYVYVIDRFGHLIGVVTLRSLITADENEKIENITNTNIISVRTDMDQEEVAKLVEKYDLLCVPVVDNKNRLVGIITVDDIIDVIREETTEDIYKLIGTSEEEFEETSILNIIKYRAPWLIMSLIGESISGSVLKFFDGTLKTAISLSFFMPLIMALGGNTGQQSQTIVVRALALGKFDESGIWIIIKRQIKTAISIGLLFAILGFAMALVFQKNFYLSLVVGSSLFISMFLSTMIGALLPLGLKKLNVDPAVAASPFISAMNDIVGLLIYLSIATATIKYFGVSL